MINAYHLTMLVIILLSYLIGSIPTAYLVAKTHKIDIFHVGSGNMGATNVTRVLGFKWGVFVLLMDVFKAIVAIFLAQHIRPETASIASVTTVAAVAVITGHNWSLFASLITGTIRGGKGAATAFGTLLMIAPFQVLFGMLFVGGVIIARTRYVSLGVLVAYGLAVAWMTLLALQKQVHPTIFIYMWILAGLILIRFRENISRLLNGTERRLGERA